MKTTLLALSLASFVCLLPGCYVEQKRTPVSESFMNGPATKFAPQERAQ